jgi:hypothetical protein
MDQQQAAERHRERAREYALKADRLETEARVWRRAQARAEADAAMLDQQQ